MTNTAGKGGRAAASLPESAVVIVVCWTLDDCLAGWLADSVILARDGVDIGTVVDVHDNDSDTVVAMAAVNL